MATGRRPCSGEVVAEALLDFLDGAAGVDEVDERLADEAEEDLAAAAEAFELLELVRGVAARADAGVGVVEGEIEEEKMIRSRGEGLVATADVRGVEAARALVGHGGKVVAVEDDDLARGEGGLDQLVDVLAAIEQEKFEFLLRGESAGGGGLAEAGAVGPVGGLAAEDDLAAGGAEPVGEESRLGGFSGAVDPFEHDEHAGSGKPRAPGFKFQRADGPGQRLSAAAMVETLWRTMAS